MALATHLELGRVSNLPTVLTNVMAGVALTGVLVADIRLVAVLVAMALFYVAGMYLNDAFDRDIDARERPERPIPSGRISASAAFSIGSSLLAGGLILLAVAGWGMADGTTWRAPAAGLALAGAIVAYDAWHKNNPLSPLLMGLTRMLVYVTAAAAVVQSLPMAVLEGALVMLAYLIGLTYVAKQENLVSFTGGWPLLFLATPFVYFAFHVLDSPSGLALYAAFALWVAYALSVLFRGGPGSVPKTVVSLIAGISLLDALFVVLGGYPMIAWSCAVGFIATLFLQRYVSGT